MTIPRPREMPTVQVTWTLFCDICDATHESGCLVHPDRRDSLPFPGYPSGWSYCQGKVVCPRHGIVIVPPLGE